METETTHTNYPSRFKIGQEVDLDFGNSKYLKNVKVVGIHFTESKISYDILVPYQFNDESFTLEKVDSTVVVDCMTK